MIFNGKPVPWVDPKSHLTAKFYRFVRADGTLDKDAACWRVFMGKKLVDVYMVKQLEGETGMEYDDIATSDFGNTLLKELREGNADV